MVPVSHVRVKWDNPCKIRIVPGKQQTFSISGIFFNCFWFWGDCCYSRGPINTLKEGNRCCGIIAQMILHKRKTFKANLYFMRNYKIYIKKINYPKHLNLKQEEEKQENKQFSCRYSVSASSAKSTKYFSYKSAMVANFT